MGRYRGRAPAFGRAAGRDCPRSELRTANYLSAVSAILTASKINLANIALTMKVQTHEELEERMKELEGKVALGKGQTGWASSVRDEMKLCMSCRLSHVTSDKQ